MPSHSCVAVALAIAAALVATTGATPIPERAPPDNGAVETGPSDNAGAPSLVGVQPLCECSCKFRGSACDASGTVCACAIGLDLKCACTAID